MEEDFTPTSENGVHAGRHSVESLDSFPWDSFFVVLACLLGVVCVLALLYWVVTSWIRSAEYKRKLERAVDELDSDRLHAQAEARRYLEAWKKEQKKVEDVNEKLAEKARVPKQKGNNAALQANADLRRQNSAAQDQIDRLKKQVGRLEKDLSESKRLCEEAAGMPQSRFDELKHAEQEKNEAVENERRCRDERDSIRKQYEEVTARLGEQERISSELRERANQAAKESDRRASQCEELTRQLQFVQNENTATLERVRSEHAAAIRGAEEKHASAMQEAEQRHAAALDAASVNLQQREAALKAEVEQERRKGQEHLESLWPKSFLKGPAATLRGDLESEILSGTPDPKALALFGLIHLAAASEGTRPCSDICFDAGRAFYEWARIGDETRLSYESLFAEWLGALLADADFTVAVAKAGQEVIERFHANQGAGQTIKQPLSYLIKRQDGSAYKKAVVLT